MINKYYQLELAHLKELAVEFSKAHPALAPMLSGPTSDPDVERLLEGTAFLTGLIREKLDDQFPEILHSLLQLTFPHYLRPIPSTTIIQFLPKTGLMETLKVKAGAAIASIPVDGTSCVFTTTYDVDVHPLQVTNAVLDKPAGSPPVLKVSFNLTGMDLQSWKPERLRILLSGSYEAAADRYYTILSSTQQLRFSSPEGGKPLTLPKKFLQPVGLTDTEALLPYPSNSFPGYRLLQEYFILPHKFLFFDITGWEHWRERGSGTSFTIEFLLKDSGHIVRDFKRGNFLLNATPAINLFPHDAEPILLDHHRPEYRVRPADQHGNNYQVYSVENVTGFIKGTVRQRDYVPFEMFRPRTGDTSVYNITRRISPIGENVEVFLSVSYPPDAGPPVPETLSINMLCTNAHLPESLQLGDISEPTETSPSLLDFKNIHPPTAAIQPPIGSDLLWRLISHLSLNYLPISDTENIKALLRLYIFPGTRNRASVVANNKRIDGVNSLTDKIADRLISGVIMRGRYIEMEVDGSNFASHGDMYLFGTILDRFLAGYANINSFTRFQLRDQHSGEDIQWPMRIGDRPLL